MNNTKQHYIPRVYLSAFADPAIDGEQVWVFSSKFKKIFRQSPGNILTEDDMYTVPFPSGERNLILESTLATIEGEYARVFREKIDPGQPLDQDDKAHLARFVAAMLIRTKEAKAGMLDVNDKLLDLLTLMEKAHNITEPTSQRKALEASRATIHQKSLWAGIPSLAKLIVKMKFGILSPETPESRFLTSDNPCHLINPELIAKLGADHPQNSAGLAQRDVELTLPLSPTKALFAGWKLIKETPVPFPISAQMVERVNWRTIHHAGEYIVSSSEKQLIDIVHKLESSSS